MPVYEYECLKCKHKTEALRPMRDADEPQACAKCGSQKTQRARSLVSVGSGSSGERSQPMGGCGRCGDPNGSCGLD